jgi:hypothetical protein
VAGQQVDEVPSVTVDDLMQIVGEQTVELRIVKQLKKNLEAENAALRAELANDTKEETMEPRDPDTLTPDDHPVEDADESESPHLVPPGYDKNKEADNGS